MTDAKTWNIVLAAGDGSRMASLTRILYGSDLPKQFATFCGERSMLQRTLDRIAPLAPAERTVVVVSAAHEELACRQLASFSGIDVVAQPSNVGTTAGVLLPLAHVLARDPKANVLVFPADHHFECPSRLLGAAARALQAAPFAPDGIVLLGVPADRPAMDLGWIVLGGQVSACSAPARLIERFVEKPSETEALSLLRAGALWNTFVFGGSAEALWNLSALHAPEQVALMSLYREAVVLGGSMRELLTGIYEAMPAADFSRQVLSAADGLGLVELPDAGWSDWGTPDRLMQTLEGTPALHELLCRVWAAGKLLDTRRSAPWADPIAT